jgi:hypothetical protein
MARGAQKVAYILARDCVLVQAVEQILLRVQSHSVTLAHSLSERDYNFDFGEFRYPKCVTSHYCLHPVRPSFFNQMALFK